MSDTVSACGDVPNVVIPIGKELAQDVDSHDAQPAVCFNLQYGHDRLVQDGIADVL